MTELKGRLQTAHQLAKDRLIASKVRSKEYYDRKAELTDISVCEKVLLYDETVRRGRSKKLCSQWIGPYEAIERDKMNATIKKGQKLLKVPVNRLKPFH